MRALIWLLSAWLAVVPAFADSAFVAPTPYVQGTWSPTITGAATPGTGQTYTIQVGSYEQIGRQVTARFTILLSSSGTAAGGLQVNNLPVASANVTNDFGTCYISQYTVVGLAALNYGLTASIAPNTSLATVYANNTTGTTAVTVAQAGNALLIVGSCNYRAS